MAHHSNESSFKTEDFTNQFKMVSPDDRKQGGINPNALKSLGATGNFPEGKLNEDDEGEIKIGITTHEGKVIIDFGKPVHWIGFTKSQAKLIGQSLIDRSNEII